MEPSFLEDLNAVWMWQLGTWVNGKFSSAGRMVGLEDLRGLLQSKGFCASVNQERNSSNEDAPVQAAVWL